jgi:hypothetical protein
MQLEQVEKLTEANMPMPWKKTKRYHENPQLYHSAGD